MATITSETLAAAIATGALVPCLGPGALQGVIDPQAGRPIPADSDSLILAMNNGQPMAPKLMWEFPRAAMHVELKRGRNAVQKFLDRTYGEIAWTSSELHQTLASLRPPYVIDLNRDGLLQAAYSDTPHTLIRGFARLGGSDYRFKIFHYDGDAYREIEQADIDPRLPFLFKPLGSPGTGSSYIASDADFVDYLTELMGGFAIPDPIKQHRVGRQYLMIGLRFTRDTERMLVADLIHGAADTAGWAMLDNPTRKEQRFCQRQRLETLDLSIVDLVSALADIQSRAVDPTPALAAHAP